MRTRRNFTRSGFAGARRTIGAVSFAALAAFLASADPALALDKVTFGLNWLADPEAGGYYQAVVDGAYAKYGLDVTILPAARRATAACFCLRARSTSSREAICLAISWPSSGNIPIVAVAADFQKDPQIFMSHPDVGLDKWTDLPKASTGLRQRRRLVLLLRLDGQSLGLQLCERQAVRFQFSAVHR